MTATALSLNDIDHWRADDITAVSEAATARALGTRAASAAITQAMGFLDWSGESGDGARIAVCSTAVELDSHADACAEVGRAAQRAAGDVTAVKLRLQQIRDTARIYHLNVDAETAQVRLPMQLSVFSAAEQREITDARLRVHTAIEALLAAADHADASLAAVIHGADSCPPAASDCRPALLPRPPAADADPEIVNSWWRSLTATQQRLIEESAPDALRNTDGIPVDVRNGLNRAALPGEIARMQNGTLDRDGRVHVNRNKLADLTALQHTVGSRPDLRLLLLDTAGNPRLVLAAVAAGDVDAAERVGVTVGGMKTRVRDSVADMAGEAIAQRDTATAIRGRARLANPAAVASIAWLGYETPGLDRGVTQDGLARAGAERLNRFYRGLAVTSQVPHTAGHRLVAFGHSYGSLTTSLALQHGAPVGDVVLYGSPGAEVDNASKLGVAPGHAYFEIGVDDRVATVLAETRRFGSPVQQVPGFQQLATVAGADPYGGHHDRSYGHSEYTRMGDVDRSTLTMGGYNLAAVLSGVRSATISAAP